jgi:hypothetical protein
MGWKECSSYVSFPLTKIKRTSAEVIQKHWHGAERGKKCHNNLNSPGYSGLVIFPDPHMYSTVQRRIKEIPSSAPPPSPPPTGKKFLEEQHGVCWGGGGRGYGLTAGCVLMYNLYIIPSCTPLSPPGRDLLCGQLSTGSLGLGGVAVRTGFWRNHGKKWCAGRETHDWDIYNFVISYFKNVFFLKLINKEIY